MSNVARTTVPVYVIVRHQAYSIYDTGSWYSFSRRAEQTDKYTSEHVEDYLGDLSDHYRLVTFEGKYQGQTFRDTFAVDVARGFIDWDARDADGNFYDASGKIMDYLHDAEWCIRHKVLTNLRHINASSIGSIKSERKAAASKANGSKNVTTDATRQKLKDAWTRRKAVASAK